MQPTQLCARQILMFRHWLIQIPVSTLLSLSILQASVIVPLLAQDIPSITCDFSTVYPIWSLPFRSAFDALVATVAAESVSVSGSAQLEELLTHILALFEGEVVSISDSSYIPGSYSRRAAAGFDQSLSDLLFKTVLAPSLVVDFGPRVALIVGHIAAFNFQRFVDVLVRLCSPMTSSTSHCRSRAWSSIRRPGSCGMRRLRS
jgi:hypothetical protein